MKLQHVAVLQHVQHAMCRAICSGHNHKAKELACAVQAVRPHLGAIAAKMEEMWAANQLSVSERNVLCDSMLAAAASGPPDLHTQVSLHSPYTSDAMQPRHQETCSP